MFGFNPNRVELEASTDETTMAGNSTATASCLSVKNCGDRKPSWLLLAGKAAQRFDVALVAAAGTQQRAPALSMGRRSNVTRPRRGLGPITMDCQHCVTLGTVDWVKRPWRCCDKDVKYRVTNVRYEWV